MTISEKDSDKQTVVSLSIKDKVSLRKYYMPFIAGGGLFIPNQIGYELGDDVSIVLNLMDEAEEIPFTGKVVWVAKEGVKNPHDAGIGVQFDDPNNVVKDKIETCMTGALDSPETTATM